MTKLERTLAVIAIAWAIIAIYGALTCHRLGKELQEYKSKPVYIYPQ